MSRELRHWCALSLLLFACACSRQEVPTQVPAATLADAVPAITEGMDAREREAAWQRLPVPEQAQLREAAQAFAALTDAERQRLRQEFEEQEPVAREGWLLGPTLGAAWPHLSPLFEYVPEAEREPLLTCLHGLSPQALDALGRIAWRTPVGEREALRAQLLQVPPAERESWLIERAER